MFAAVMAAVSLAGIGSVATSSSAQAEALCVVAQCGKVINNSGQTIKIRWWVNNRWHEETLANGRFQGGYDGDFSTNDIDVDQVYVPLGCVARVRVSNNNLRYFPGGWDKLAGNQTVTVDGFNCGDGHVYAWNNIWNDDNYATASCRWFNDDRAWEDDCYDWRARADSVQNNSSRGNAVNLYSQPNFAGAWGCLGAGSVWRDLRYNYFSWGPGLNSYGAAMRDRIASSKWVRACGS